MIIPTFANLKHEYTVYICIFKGKVWMVCVYKNVIKYIIHNSLHPPQIPSQQNNFPISFQPSFGIPSLRSDVWPLRESLWNPGPHLNNKNPKTFRGSKTVFYWFLDLHWNQVLLLSVHCKFKTSLYDMWSFVVPVVEWWVACDAHPPETGSFDPQPCCCQGLLFSIQHLH